MGDDSPVCEISKKARSISRGCYQRARDKTFCAGVNVALNGRCIDYGARFIAPESRYVK